MLSPVFQDLLKPRWRRIIETLKEHGGMALSGIARHTGGHYMTVKAHCDELTAAGYLLRTRLPRTEVGRPEIFFSLAAKADTLFPQADADFTLDLLKEVRHMFRTGRGLSGDPRQVPESSKDDLIGGKARFPHRIMILPEHQGKRLNPIDLMVCI